MNQIKTHFLRLFLCTLFMSFISAGFAQQGGDPSGSHKVTGTVVDANTGETLLGVNIVILETKTKTGVISDMDGRFSMSVPANATLEFSYVGYQTKTIAVAKQAVLKVSLDPDVQKLDEVVVVGYGSQKKKDLTSAIAIVDSKALSKTPVSSVVNALQGLTSGVEVQGNQGSPGSLATVRIRGVSSINSTDPLYVIDGIPMDGASVNAADIESMQVLKDAASCAIYGSRGANGVIIITTKNGKTGAPKVRYNGYYGISDVRKKLDLLNMHQWAALVSETNTAGGTTAPPLALDIVAHPNGPWTGWDGTETNWQDQIFQTGSIMENNIDVSGGTNNGNYYFSANQYKENGIIIDTPFKRYSVRMNSNWQTNKFKFGENMSYIFTQSRVEGSNGGRDMLEEVIKITPNIPVRNPNVLGGYSGYDGSLVGHDASNPVGSLERSRNFNYNKLFFANAYGDYELMKGLNLRSTFGVTSSEFQNRNFTPQTDMQPKAFTTTSLSESAAWTYNWDWENMLTFHRVFGDHDITAMAAHTAEYSKYHNMQGNGITIQTETNDVLGMLESGYKVTGSESETSRESYLGRVSYSYKGRYMLTANFRRDGSSKFGPGLKWGNFPSASVAWRLSDEPFMKRFSFISNLKLRSSYGEVGNDAPVGSYSYISGLAAGQDYTFNGVQYTGVAVTGFNNPTLTWESVKQLDLGVDLGLLNGTFEATFDYYHKKTTDMIFGYPLPASSGAGGSGSINKNLGSILNRGFELSVTYRQHFGKLDMSITGNMSTLHNEVLDMAGKSITGGVVEPGNCTMTAVGHQIGEFYGWQTGGLFQTQAEINSYTYKDASGATKLTYPNAKPGDIKFVDRNNDGQITDADKYFMGKPIPTFTYGLTANFAYKGFDLSLFFQGISGNKIFAEQVCWTEGMQNNFNAGTATLDRWTPSHTNTTIPRAVRNDPNGNISKVSDRYIKDGAYTRLKNVSLGYTIPKTWASKLNISSLRMYVTARNLLTFTNYPFYDPEIGSSAIGAGGTANTSRGIDNGYYPQPRTFIAGIQLDF
jgi:Outer membrane cobalamin receptor protein